MKLHQEAITEEMRIVANLVFEQLPQEYYLAGGTALALQIGHRKSDQYPKSCR